MKKKAILIAMMLVLTSLAFLGQTQAASGGFPYSETVDIYEYSVGGTISWEHHYDVSAGVVQSATLTIVADDVDASNPDNPSDGEMDAVYFNGNLLGYLNQMPYYTNWAYEEGPGNSAPDQITTTTFDLDPAWIEETMPAEVEIEASWGVEIETSTLDIEYQYLSVEKTLESGNYFVPIFTEEFFDLKITAENLDDDNDEMMDNIWVYDSMGAHIKLVEQTYSDTYTDIIDDNPDMGTRTQTNFDWSHTFDLDNIVSAELTIGAWDIDYDSAGEIVEILADTTYNLGNLEDTGNDLYGETTFTIDIGWLTDGKLDVYVDFDDRAGYEATIESSTLTIVYEYDYIFTLDGTPIPLVGDDNIYFGDNGDYVEWWQANKKDPIKNPCATLLMWEVGDLDDAEYSTLEFTVKTIQFEVGPKKNPQTKQAFTSTCHHDINDGPVTTYEYDGETYYYWADPVTVSVYYTYDQDPEADSDCDGLYDWEEVDGEYVFITDPCCWDTDGDGFGDGYEIDHGSDPLDSDCYPPSFDNADLIYWTSEDPTEYHALVPFYPDYQLELDELVDWFYLNLDEVEIDGLPLQDAYYGFMLTPPDVEDDFWDWWELKGVYDGCTGTWEPLMWDILNGDLPMFYIKVSNCGTEYMLVDGLQYKLFEIYDTASGLTTYDNPFRINGDYPLGEYTVAGIIENQCGAWEDVTITMDFHRWEHLETIEIPTYSETTPPPTVSTNTLESGKLYKLVASGTADAGAGITFDAEYSSTNGHGWVDGVEAPYDSYGPDLLDLKVDGYFIDWGAYDSSHIYEIEMPGTGSTASFLVYDIHYPSNIGSLYVDIYEWV